MVRKFEIILEKKKFCLCKWRLKKISLMIKNTVIFISAAMPVAALPPAPAVSAAPMPTGRLIPQVLNKNIPLCL